MLKVHGTKNTFYIVDSIINDKKNKAINLCEDGTDGVLYVLESDIGLAKMRIFNADGSEAEMCGNGLRCFARYILERDNLKEGVIETLCESYFVKYVYDFYGQIGISIVLSPVKFLDNESVNEYSGLLNHEYHYFTVSNPHVVAEYDSLLSNEALIEIGLLGQKIFESGINVNIYKVLDDNKIYVRTFERGVGLTPSCGTGMTSASVDYAIKTNTFNTSIEVYNDGGLVVCNVAKVGDDYSVEFIGNATYIAAYDHDILIKSYEDEGKVYEKFYKKTREII